MARQNQVCRELTLIINKTEKKGSILGYSSEPNGVHEYLNGDEEGRRIGIRGQEKLDWILLALKMGGAHKAKEYGQLLGTEKDENRFSPTAFK